MTTHVKNEVHDGDAGSADPDRANSAYADYRKRESYLLRRRLLTWAVVAGGFFWAVSGTGFGVLTLIRGFYISVDFIVTDMLPPRLDTIPRFIGPALDTLYMSYVGMIISIMISFPLGILAARNTTVNRAIGTLTRGIVGFIRAMPELVFAIFIVAIIGIGPAAGAVAIGVGGVGILGKGYADALETVDMRQVEGIRAAGGSWLHVISQGVWPQFKPSFITWSLYRMELNIRTASVLGLVGAGGLGFSLTREIRLFQYQSVTTIILLIFVMVVVVEMITRALRRRIL